MNDPNNSSQGMVALVVIIFCVCLALPILLTFIFATTQRSIRRSVKKILGIRTRRFCPKHAADMKYGMCILDSANCDICHK